jgi:predicted dienelactone hydrolase
MIIFLCSLVLGGCIMDVTGVTLDVNPVGVVFRNYSDPTRKSWDSDRPRPLQTMIWYPAEKDVKTSEQTIAIFKTGNYKIDATFNTDRKRFPLIVVSHGTGGSSASIAWLCTKLASAGYVVAAVNHHGNTGAESKYLIEGFMLWWERAADIHVLIDNLITDPLLGPRIDSDKIGVSGFSIGGYTALATIGARLDIERWKPYCSGNEGDPICHLPPEANYKMEEVWWALENNQKVHYSWPKGNQNYLDQRIKAAFVIAPVVGPIITKESLRSIRVPVRLVVGSNDDQAVPSMNAIPFSKLIPTNELEVLPRVTHYTFLSEGTWWGKIIAGKFLNDPTGIDRHEIQKRVSGEAVGFFNSIFK